MNILIWFGIIICSLIALVFFTMFIFSIYMFWENRECGNVDETIMFVFSGLLCATFVGFVYVLATMI